MDNIPFFNTSENVRIKVIGLGGCGGNITGMLYENSIPDIDYYALNTDIQALFRNNVENRIQIGKKLTGGKGAGADFEKGYLSMIHDIDVFDNIFENTGMAVFIAGLGGGTGTGSIIPAVEKAKDSGLLTLSIVTIPFSFEGNLRKRKAEEVCEYLKNISDSTVVIKNDRLLSSSQCNTRLKDAFSIVDSFLDSNMRNILSVINNPGIINLDFADLNAILKDSGEAFMGSGKGSGKNRAEDAYENTLRSPLLDSNISGFSKIFVNISGNEVSLNEVNTIVGRVNDETDGNAEIIFGTSEIPGSDELFLTILLSGKSDEKEMC